MKNYRWVICALLFFATTINYIDRQIIGLLKPLIEAEFNWTESDYSRIVMAFTASYAVGLLLFGRFIDIIGTKLGYAISVTVWSIAAMGHALARNTLGFSAARAALGLGESGNFPAAIKAVAEWFPKKERALATGIFNSGANIGAVAAPLLIPVLVTYYGWKEAFIITGAIGFVWLVLWWWLFDKPEKHPKVSGEELAYIKEVDAAVPDNKEAAAISWLSLLRNRNAWAFIIAKFLTDPIWWFFLFWLPAFFAAAFHIDLKSPSIHLAVVYSATTLGSIGGGYLSGWLIGKGWSPYKARKIAMLVFALAVMPIALTQFSENEWIVVALISLAAASHQAWSANLFTTVSDAFPSAAVSSVVGMGGMAGSVGGILFPIVIGYLLDYYKSLDKLTTGYHILFIMCAGSYMLAWLFIHLLTRKRAV